MLGTCWCAWLLQHRAGREEGGDGTEVSKGTHKIKERRRKMTSLEAQRDDQDEVTSSEDLEKAKTRARCALLSWKQEMNHKVLKIIALMFYFITFYLMFGSATHFNCICHHCHVHFLSSLITCRFRYYLLVEIEIYFYPLASSQER